MSVSLAVATESNAHMLVIFNKLYDGIIKNKLGESLNILKSKRTALVLSGLNSTKHCFAQFESMMRS